MFRRIGYENFLKLSQTKPEELMAELAKFFMAKIWPVRPDSRFESIAEQLKPLKEIEEILNPETIKTICLYWQ